MRAHSSLSPIYVYIYTLLLILALSVSAVKSYAIYDTQTDYDWRCVRALLSPFLLKTLYKCAPLDILISLVSSRYRVCDGGTWCYMNISGMVLPGLTACSSLYHALLISLSTSPLSRLCTSGRYGYSRVSQCRYSYLSAPGWVWETWSMLVPFARVCTRVRSFGDIWVDIYKILLVQRSPS